MPEIRIPTVESHPATAPAPLRAPAPGTPAPQPAPAVEERDTVQLPANTPAYTQRQSRGSHGQTTAQSAMVPPQPSPAPAPAPNPPRTVPPERDAELLRDNQETFAQLGITNTEQMQPEQGDLPVYEDEDSLVWLRQIVPIPTYDQTMGPPMPYVQAPHLEWQPAGRDVDSSLAASLGLRVGLAARGAARGVFIAGLAYSYMAVSVVAKATSHGKTLRRRLDTELNITLDLLKIDFQRTFSDKPNQLRLKRSKKKKDVTNGNS